MMTFKQYRAAIKKLGLSQVQAAHELGVDERTSRRYALGESRIPHSVELVLKMKLAEQLREQPAR